MIYRIGMNRVGEPVDLDQVEGSTKTILWRIPVGHIEDGEVLRCAGVATVFSNSEEDVGDAGCGRA